MTSVQRNRQSGAVLLLVMLVLLVTGASTLATLGNSNLQKIYRDKKTAQVLKQAKNALLAHAINYDYEHPGRFGFLPCPDARSDTNPEGREDTGCGFKDVNILGRFPWRSLSLPPLKDGAGECLWYAVSSTYKGRSTTDMLNEDSNGMFEVFNTNNILGHGNNPEDRIVAVIISAAAQLSDQNRARLSEPSEKVEACGGNYLPSNYLDGSDGINNPVLAATADQIDQFIRGQANTNNVSNPFNDRILTITQAEIWATIKKREDYTEKLDALTETLAECVASYGKAGIGENTLPWPAPVNLGTDYRSDNQYDDENNPSYSLGRLPYLIDSSSSIAGRANDRLFALTATQTAYCQLSTGPESNHKLWKNWKDHFFLVTSAGFQPGGSSSCNGTNCVTLQGDSTEYAAIVFFSGSALSGIVRNDPVASENPGTKHLLGHYLDAQNNALNGDPVGNNTYIQGTSDNAVNDILYCIEQDMDVVLCPDT